MGLKATITKDDFEKLDDALKPHYTESGDNYLLDAEGVEDVSGLKAKRDELLRELKKQKSIVQQFEGLDVDEAKKALAEMSELEKKKLAAKGQYEELLDKYKSDYEQQLNDANSKAEQLMANLKRQQLQNFLTEKGVLPDRAKFALIEAQDRVELDSTDEGFKLKLKDGIGDVKELDGMVEKLKAESPFLFGNQTAPGSGAEGNGNNGNGHKGKWDEMSAREKSAAISEFGSYAEAKKQH